LDGRRQPTDTDGSITFEEQSKLGGDEKEVCVSGYYVVHGELAGEHALRLRRSQNLPTLKMLLLLNVHVTKPLGLRPKPVHLKAQLPKKALADHPNPANPKNRSPKITPLLQPEKLHEAGAARLHPISMFLLKGHLPAMDELHKTGNPLREVFGREVGVDRE
jgi:hypothetical protein